MEPPPPPSSGRFRLRIQIIEKKDANNTGAFPKKSFTVAKNSRLALPNLTLNELCIEIVKRYQQLYPGESLFAVDTTQDSSGSDLWLEDTVSDLFEDNDIFRVIKGAPIRASVEPHRARSQSIQPNGVMSQQKLIYPSTFGAPTQRVDPQRLYNLDPDRPIFSRERESIEPVLQPRPFASSQISFIPDSQQTILDDIPDQSQNGFVQVSSSYQPPLNRVDGIAHGYDAASHSRPSPELGMRAAHISTKLNDEMRPLPHEFDRLDDDAPPKAPSSGLKRKKSMDENPSGSRQTSPASVTSFPQQDKENTAKRLKRVVTYSKVVKPKKSRDVYDDVESEPEGGAVPPTTPLPQVISALKSKAMFRPRTTSTSSRGGSSVLNARGSREDSVASITRSLKSSPEDPAERLRRARAAQRIAVEKENERRAAAQQKDNARIRKTAGSKEDDESMPIPDGEDEEEPFTEEEQARLAKEMRNADAKKARRERQQAEQEAVRRQFEAERTRSAVAKQYQTEQDMATLPARTTDKGAAEAKENSARQDTMGHKASTKANGEVEDQGQTRKENASKLRNAVEDKKREDAEEKARKAAARRSADVEQIDKSQKPVRSLDSTTLKPSDTISNGGMFARAVRNYEKVSQGDDLDIADINQQEVQESRRVSCTPFIPRGRPPLPVSASQAPSQVAPSSPPALSPLTGVGIETQMPLPGNFRRSVSSAGSASKTSAAGNIIKPILKQTTLVPPRSSAPSSRITPSRPLGKRASKFVIPPKQSKGKGKADESTGSPPNPIQISSDESSSDSGSDDIDTVYDRFGDSRIDGPAYPRGIKSTNETSKFSSTPTSSLKPYLRHSESEVGNGTTLQHNKIIPTTGVSARHEPSTKLKDNLKMLSAAGFPTPSQIPYQAALGVSTQTSLHGSAQVRKEITNPESLVKNREPAQSTAKFMVRVEAPTRPRDSDHGTKTRPQRLSTEDIQQEPVLNQKTIVPQTWSFNNATTNEADEPPSSPQLPELPNQSGAGDHTDATSHDDSISTQSEIDQQLMSQSRESKSRSSSLDSTSSSSSSPTPPPAKVRRGIARMAKESLAEVAAKNAIANSEGALRAKRVAEERLQKEADEAAAALQLSSTESERTSASDDSSDGGLDEDDPRVKGNLYNGTGFRKSVVRGDMPHRGGSSRANTKPRGEKKYQKHPHSGKMVKVGKYEIIDKNTGRVTQDLARVCARLGVKKGTQQPSGR